MNVPHLPPTVAHLRESKTNALPPWSRPPIPGRGGYPRFANGAGVLNSVSMVMSNLEANPIMGLVVSDLGGMVLPRTGIELYKRGPIPAQETFFREITGTVTNTFLAGWLGALVSGFFGTMAMLGFKVHKTNPKAMDFGAWIDSKTLESFGNIVKEQLRRPEIQTAEQLREAFLKATLGRLEPTDNVWRLPEYRDVFRDTNNGRLGNNALSHMVDRLMGRTPGTHHAYNLEAMVAERMKQHEYREELAQALRNVEAKFMEQRGHRPLDRAQRWMLDNLKTIEERTLLARQKQEIRLQVAKTIRQGEGRFLQEMFGFATGPGKLTEEVFMLDAQGKRMEQLGVQNLRDMLRKVKHFTQEFLNRAMASEETGVIAEGVLDKARVSQRLFGRRGGSWFQRNVVPALQDGLLPYVYKSKLFMVAAPLVLTIAMGCAMVVVNNAMTRKKTGANYFPGEQALLEKELKRGGGVA